MGRPRQYDVDGLLAQARLLWVEHGIDGVTMRALGASSGASNGAVYHAFGSRDGLLARVWAGEARQFLALQRRQVAEALRDADPTSALVVAALAPASYAVQDEAGARLLLSATADQLITSDLDDDGRALLRGLQEELGGLLEELAVALWERDDRAAVTTVRYCVVNLPGTLLLDGRGITDPLARHVLEQAVRGVARDEPPRH